MQGAIPDAARALMTVNPGVVGRPVTAIMLNVGRVGVNQEAGVEVFISVQQRREVSEGTQRRQQLASDARRRVYHDVAVRPVLPCPRLQKPAGGFWRQGMRGRAQVK